MIAYLNGKITFKSPTHILMEIGGIGYLVKISLNTFEKIQHLDSCRLNTAMVVKNENQSVSGFELYGFYEDTEKELFEKLISVSGIGASTARVMLSTFKPDEIRQAILTENEVMIQSIKGIGPKSAKRVILELKDKVGKVSEGQILTVPQSNTMKEEALFALLALGFNKQAAEKVLAKLTANGAGASVEGLIKEALKLL
ncbi:MAG TPA: Holliday junction branch migration protein RuvA [Chitinophagales bacterium]|nr:Holliday junction branch migration protein RuvA [Chitinophagales bacterium]